jgi:mannosyltransferase
VSDLTLHSETDPLPRRVVLALAIIVLGALALRLVNLAGQSQWADEALSAAIARGPATAIIANQYRSLQPPGYYLMLFYWRATFGDSDLALRLPSALLGAASVLAMFRLGRRLFSPATGFWAALVTALMPFHLFYSQETRMYSLVFLLSALAILSMARLWSESGRRDWLAYALVCLLGLYTHYFFTLVVVTLATYFVLRRLRSGVSCSWRAFVVVHLALLLTFMPLVLLLPGQLSQANYDWRSSEGLASLFVFPLQLSTGLFLERTWGTLGFGLVLALLIVGLLQAGGALLRREPARWSVALTLMSYWVPVGALLLISVLWTPVMVTRLAMVAVPGLYIFLAWGASQPRERRFNAALLLLLLLVALRADVNWLFDPQYAKPDSRAAAHRLAELAGPDEPIIYTNDSGFLLFVRYAAPLDHRLLVTGAERSQVIAGAYRLMDGELIETGDPLPDTFWLVLHQDYRVEEQEAVYEAFAAYHDQLDYVNISGVRLYRFAGPGTVPPLAGGPGR